MDAGDYETNTLAITNIASISYRVYRHVATPTSSLYAYAPSDVERTLRNNGHLVFNDARRQGFWCFHLVRKDGSVIGLHGGSTTNTTTTTIEVGPHKLAVVDEGAFEPSSLVRGRPFGGNAMNTPNSAVNSTSNGQSVSDSATAAAETNQPASNPPRPFPPATPKLVYNLFLSAVIASIASAYCLRANAIALNSRTFLLPPLDPLWDGEESSRTDTKALVATLRVSLTPAGALLVNLSHAILQGMGCSEWACYAGTPPPPGATVLTAPWGSFATVRGTYPSGHAPPSLVPQAWKVFAAKMLEMRGTSTSVLHDSSWLQVEFALGGGGVGDDDHDDDDDPNKSVIILWPSVLCFWSLESAVVSAPSFQRLDPLDDLRAAFLEEARAEEAAFRPDETLENGGGDGDGGGGDGDDDDLVMEDAPTVSSMDKGPLSDGPSPLGARQSHLSLAGTMYPTPPDGLLGLVGATPTFDGSIASPGGGNTNHNTVGTFMPTGGGGGDVHGDGDDAVGTFWVNNEPTKRDEADEAFIAEPDDNLFADIDGGDILGDDVTDADFSFFDDKQPDGGGGMHRAADVSANIDTNAGDKMELDTSSSRPGDTPMYMQSDMEAHADVGGTTPDTPAVPESAAEAAAATEPPAAVAVFAKPELRHARSNLGDSNNNNTTAKANVMKRPPSPFNAVTVFKRVRARPDASMAAPAPMPSERPSLLDRRGKLFAGLQFTDFMIANNKKYEADGKFGFGFRWTPPASLRIPDDLGSATSPTAFRRPVKKTAATKKKQAHLLSDPSPGFASLVSSITRGLQSSSLHGASPLMQPMEDNSGGDASSSAAAASSSSSSYESSEEEEEEGEEEGEGDEVVGSVSAGANASTTNARSPAAAEPPPSLEAASELSKAYVDGIWDVPIARFFSEPRPSPTELAYADDDIVDVAQIVTQQITRATIRTSFDEDSGQSLPGMKLRQTRLQRIRYSMATLQEALPAGLDDARRCTLKAYLDVPDMVAAAGGATAGATAGATPIRSNLWAASTPSVAIRRNDATLSILPTAIDFWEVLGLEPLHGAKDIRAVCVFPGYAGLAAEVAGFLGRMRVVYESLRLGSHVAVASKGNIVDGMVAFDPLTPSSSSARPEFPGADQLHKLAQALAAEDAPGKSLVVYFVYCEEVTTGVVDACVAFQRLAQLYESAVTGRTAGKDDEASDLVLQLLPVSFVARATSLAVASPTAMLHLSLEVYDRCASANARGPKPAAPAFLLEQPPPRILDLKLTPTPPVDVQRENSCMHVAYAYSADGRWVTAAWTDSSGWRQFSAAYWLGRKGGGGSRRNTFAMVAQEMWTNTCALVASLKVHWRAIISKCVSSGGAMEPAEMDTWTALSRAETRVSMSVTLVTVDTAPALELLPPVVTASPAVLAQLSAVAQVAAAQSAQSAATPQASSVFSPEQTGNPATPAGTTPAGAPTPATPSGGGAGGPVPNSPAGTATATNNSNTTSAAAAAAAAAAADASAKLAAAGTDPNTVVDIDGNAVLVDITDNTWLAVAAHRLNTAATWVDARYALVSGYIIKRGGVGRDEAPVVMEVNVVRADGNARVHDAVARDVLAAYRALGTLARARGILDSERDVRPWHIAAAERAAQGLCRWM